MGKAFLRYDFYRFLLLPPGPPLLSADEGRTGRLRLMPVSSLVSRYSDRLLAGEESHPFERGKNSRKLKELAEGE